MPEKSGIDTSPFVLLPVCPIAGIGVCPRAGVAAAAANVTNKRKSSRCALMISSLRGSPVYIRVRPLSYFTSKTGSGAPLPRVVELLIRPVGARYTRALFLPSADIYMRNAPESRADFLITNSMTTAHLRKGWGALSEHHGP